MKAIEFPVCLQYGAWFLLLSAAAALLQGLGIDCLVSPISSCYSFDSSGHLHDFSNWIGHAFEFEGKESDIVVRFCKDVQSRSRAGYVDFGRFDSLNYFVPGSASNSFVQEFYEGDLMNCEQSHDKMGRTAHVDIYCGGCMNGQCRDGLGCICNVTQESSCSVSVELAIPCGEEHAPRVFKGFTVGFHPRTWEIVYNGMTNAGFEKANHHFSFGMQRDVALYMTSVASLSHLVEKPKIEVFPENGLEVRVSGSAVHGASPTTMSPTVLNINWRCKETRLPPYEVRVAIPIKGYDPIEFILSKQCERKEEEEGGDRRRKGWAVFGIISFVFAILSALFCCGGFIYKTRIEERHGLDALPGMPILVLLLETITGHNGYSRPEDINSPYVDQASWGKPSSSTTWVLPFMSH